MTQQNETRSSRQDSPFLRSLGTVLGVVLRLLFVIVLGVGIGAGLYFGVPWAYHNLVAPVQENRARIIALEQRSQQLGERSSQARATLQARVAELEATVAALDESATIQEEELTEAITQLQALAAEVDDLAEKQYNHVAALHTAVADVNLTIKMTLEPEISNAQATLEAQATALATQSNALKIETARLDGRLALLQTANDLLRVRMYLLEDNPRQAREALTAADLHLQYAQRALSDQAATVAELRERVTTLEELIENRSFRVDAALEALWNDVIDLALPPEALPTSTPTPTLTPTPMPGTVTPTPPASPLPTPTP